MKKITIITGEQGTGKTSLAMQMVLYRNYLWTDQKNLSVKVKYLNPRVEVIVVDEVFLNKDDPFLMQIVRQDYMFVKKQYNDIPECVTIPDLIIISQNPVNEQPFGPEFPVEVLQISNNGDVKKLTATPSNREMFLAGQVFKINCEFWDYYKYMPLCYLSHGYRPNNIGSFVGPVHIKEDHIMLYFHRGDRYESRSISFSQMEFKPLTDK